MPSCWRSSSGASCRAGSEGKRYGELRLQELADENFTPVILRQGTVYGFSPRMRYDLVVNTFVKDAMKDGLLSLHGNGEMWSPLVDVDVDDVAQAHIAALAAPDCCARPDLQQRPRQLPGTRRVALRHRRDEEARLCRQGAVLAGAVARPRLQVLERKDEAGHRGSRPAGASPSPCCTW